MIIIIVSVEYSGWLVRDFKDASVVLSLLLDVLSLSLPLSTLGGPHRERCSASNPPSPHRSWNWRVHLWRVHLSAPIFLFTIAWTTLRKRSKNMIFVNKIEVYNLKKRACGGLHSQRCSTCNVTHPQHHQSHHTSGAQEDSACTRTLLHNSDY